MHALETARDALSMVKYNLLVSAKKEEAAMEQFNDVARRFLITLPGRVQSYPVLTLKPATQDMLLSVASSLHQHTDLGFALTPRKKQFQRHDIDRGMMDVPVMYPQINVQATWRDKDDSVRSVENLGGTCMVRLEQNPIPMFFKLFNEFPDDSTRETGRAAIILIPDHETFSGRSALAQVLSEARSDWRSNRDGSQLRVQRPDDMSNLFYAIGETTMYDRLMHVWFADISTRSADGNAPHPSPPQHVDSPILGLTHT